MYADTQCAFFFICLFSYYFINISFQKYPIKRNNELFSKSLFVKLPSRLPLEVSFPQEKTRILRVCVYVHSENISSLWSYHPRCAPSRLKIFPDSWNKMIQVYVYLYMYIACLYTSLPKPASPQEKHFNQYETLILFFFSFLGPYLLHMEVPRLGVESELQLQAYTTATATLDLSCACNLHCSLQEYNIFLRLKKKKLKVFIWSFKLCITTISKQSRFYQSNLQIQCNPYKIIHDISHRTRTNNPKIYMEP